MPYACVQFGLQGKNSGQEIVTIHSAIMDGLIGWAEYITGPILRQTAAVIIIGTFLLRQLPDASFDLIVMVSRIYRPPFCQFFWRSFVCRSFACC